MVSCKDCIHYNVCCLWSTTDLDESESYNYCFGNFKSTADEELVKIKSDGAKEVLKKIKRELEEAINNNDEVRRERLEKHGELFDEFDNHIYGKILALDGMLGFIEHLEEEYE